ncbi:MAG: hypothetical protein IPK76_02845 [Lewinellaceae bacterium]|nr:hypothetical protein [Lewinellaceae bacterium]
MRTKTVALLCSAMLLTLGQAFAQTDRALLRELAQENKQSIEALVLYPENARLAILEAAKYPEVLIKMQSIRTKTGAAFRTLIEDFPRSSQEIFFDISRFPGLTAALVSHQNDRTALSRDLEQMPEDKRSDALGLVERQMASLVKINDLNQTAQGAFDQLIATYPAPAQQAFRTLLGLPEVIDILNEDLRFTILVGDIYKDDPAWVIQKMDSLNLVVAREHAEELENWQKTVENDPQARQEFEGASQEYATEYGYTDEVYDTGNDDLYAAPRAVYPEQYYQYNYPYWFGYPWWAPQPCWRPYPYWWYWGFYPYHQTVVIVHLPSYHFMHWYFYHPHHHHRYNRLSTYFVNHYYGHRKSGSTISMGVGEWRDQNRNMISDEWLGDRDRLPARLNEYAQFEQQRQKFNDKNPARVQTREEFWKKTRRNSELARSRVTAQAEIQRERSDAERQRSDWAPAKAPLKTEPAQPSRAPGVEPPKRVPAEKPAVPPVLNNRKKTKRPIRRQPEPPPRPGNPPKIRISTKPATTTATNGRNPGSQRLNRKSNPATRQRLPSRCLKPVRKKLNRRLNRKNNVAMVKDLNLLVLRLGVVGRVSTAIRVNNFETALLRHYF